MIGTRHVVTPNRVQFAKLLVLLVQHVFQKDCTRRWCEFLPERRVSLQGAASSESSEPSLFDLLVQTSHFSSQSASSSVFSSLNSIALLKIISWIASSEQGGAMTLYKLPSSPWTIAPVHQVDDNYSPSKKQTTTQKTMTIQRVTSTQYHWK